MSALDRLSPQDQERLSAYADGALPPREAAGLEARLKKEADLRLALEELRGVRVALAALPERRVPRNFTLRPEDVPRRTSRAGFVYLRFATVVATVLFVATTTVRLIPAPLMLGAAAPRAVAQEEGQTFASVAPAATAEVSAAMEVPATAFAPAPQAAADALGLAATPLPATTPEATPTLAGTACPRCPTSLALEKTEVGAMRASGEVATPVSSPISPWVVAQWALGLAAVLLGVLTLRARRGS